MPQDTYGLTKQGELGPGGPESKTTFNSRLLWAPRKWPIIHPKTNNQKHPITAIAEDLLMINIRGQITCLSRLYDDSTILNNLKTQGYSITDGLL